MAVVVLVLAAGVAVGGPVAAAPTAAAARVSRPDTMPVTNGPVFAVARAGDTIYIGGRFDRVGPRTGPGVEVGLDGVRNARLPEISGAGPSSFLGSGSYLSAVAPDGAGGWYVGGLFSHVGGVPRTNLAHIRSDGSVDPAFAPQLNDAVSSLVVAGSTIYVAGRFTSIAGQPRNRIAAFGADGRLTPFDPNADAAVEALAVSTDGSTVYAGGRFTMIGGLPRLALAALNANDGRATLTFKGAVTGSAGVGVVDALAISGSTLYLGGSFTAVAGQARSNIAAVGLDGPIGGIPLAAFNPNASRGTCAPCGSVAQIAVSGSTVYVGGMFDSIGGKPRRYLAGLNAADGTATAFDPSPNGNILGLAVAGSTVYAAGGFTSRDGSPSIGGQPRNYAAALDGATGAATAFHPNPNAVVQAFGVSASSVYLAGSFSSVGGVVRRSVAAISAIDGSITDFDPNAEGFNGGTAAVYALAVAGPEVYVGGYFGSIGGELRTSLASVSAEDGSASSWNPSPRYGTGPAVVETLGVSGATVYAGGVFTTIGGQMRSNIAAVDAADGAATDWDPAANSVVEALVVAGDVVYVGGHFTSVGGQTRNKLAALDVSDGRATSWDPDATANGNVLALAVSGSTVYAGGNFPTIRGVARPNLAAIRASDGTPTAFNPRPDAGVHALAVDGPTIYAAGFFGVIGGQTRRLVAGLESRDGSATSFDVGGSPGFIAEALEVATDGTLYVGGSFSTFALAHQQGFAQFTSPAH